MLFTPCPDLQFCSREEIAKYQNAALQLQLQYVAEKSPYYRQLFKENAVDINKVKTVEDLRCIPLTSKEDIQRHNADFYAVEPVSIIDYAGTSGTLGKPVVVPVSENDLQRLAYNEVNSYRTAGLSSADIMQLMLTLDKRFMAGLAYFLGCQKMGMGVVRVGSGVPGLQWDTVAQINPTCCMAVPTFLLKLTDYAKANGIDYRSSSLKKAICIGEGLRNPDLSLSNIGLRLAEAWPELKLFSTYASTEMQSSFTECEAQCGGHQPADLIICEFLDENGNPVPEGEPGELVITTLGVEAFPLVRFRTGDICLHFDEPCKCGRNSLRVSPLLGRKQQMIKYKGTTFYPPALCDILDSVPEVLSYVVEIFTNDYGTDDVCFRIYAQNPDDLLLAKIKDVCRKILRAVPSIVFETRETIEALRFPANSRKMVKVVDRR